MRESYREDLASQPGPESCGGGREADAEALTGVHAGQPLSCEINPFGVPTPLLDAEGNIGQVGKGKSCPDPAQSKTLRMRGNSLHGNRETPRTPTGKRPAGAVAGSGPPDHARVCLASGTCFGTGRCDDLEHCGSPSKKPTATAPSKPPKFRSTINVDLYPNRKEPTHSACGLAVSHCQKTPVKA